MRHWVLPGVNEDPIQSEADHLMKQGDDNKVTAGFINTCQSYTMYDYVLPMCNELGTLIKLGQISYYFLCKLNYGKLQCFFLLFFGLCFLFYDVHLQSVRNYFITCNFRDFKKNRDADREHNT